MKVLQSSIFRALCAIVVGALLVKYRELTVTWMTIAVGALFFVSGVISCVAYFSARRKGGDGDLDIYDAEGNLIVPSRPSFPIVGLGSVILGGLLALMPGTFVDGLVYVLAAILILGAVNQLFSLTVATRFARIGLVWWVCPVLILLVGIIAILKPSAIATAPLLIIGWCMMAYGVADLVNALKIHRCRKAFESAQRGTEDSGEGKGKDA